MSNQVKLFIYIVFVVGIFWFVQSKWHIFDIKFNGISPIVDTKEADQSDASGQNTPSNYVEIVLGADRVVKVNVELADNIDERRLGLSFRKYLGDYDGMLFAFDTEISTPFWMKDMQIPLDMIFFDSQGFIVDMKEAQPPCTDTYCPSISSNSPYKYVLEVSSGFIEKNNIAPEGSIVLHLESVN